MELFFASFDHVTWWIVGVILIIFEVFTGGTFLLWLGVAALVVGTLMFAGVPLNWQMQLILFASISILSIIVWRTVQKKRKEITDPKNPHLSRRGEQYIGQVFALAKPIINGVGKVKVADSLWQVKSEQDMPQGKKVKVLAVDSASFIVEEYDA